MNNYELLVLIVSVLGIYTTPIGFVIQLLTEWIKHKMNKQNKNYLRQLYQSL